MSTLEAIAGPIAFLIALAIIALLLSGCATRVIEYNQYSAVPLNSAPADAQDALLKGIQHHAI